MLYDIINPSDPITMDAENFQAAALATLLLGEGRFGANPQAAGGESVPIFLMGGAVEWYEKRFGTDISVDMSNPEIMRPVADALDGLMIGGFDDRADFDGRRDRNKANRTSMNNITAYGEELAKRLRHKMEGNNV